MGLEKYELGNDIKLEILERIKPVIEYALLQTSPRYREELAQHLYEVVIKVLKNVRFAEPQSLFEETVVC